MLLIYIDSQTDKHSGLNKVLNYFFPNGKLTFWTFELYKKKTILNMLSRQVTCQLQPFLLSALDLLNTVIKLQTFSGQLQL